MRFSSVARIAPLLVMAGCAHAAAPPPSTAPTAAPGATAPSASTTATPSGGAGAAGGARTTDPRLDAGLDPSEEITAEELASIPEPVPGASAAVPAASAASGAPEPATPGAAWRVQIFASPDLAAADSVAKSASAVLEAPYTIEYEGTLYKVRLGAFGSEQEAQALRDRAIQSGFLGAFRVRSGEVPLRSRTK